MIISPKSALDKGWINLDHLSDDERKYFREKCIQPNAVDIPMHSFRMQRSPCDLQTEFSVITEEVRDIRPYTQNVENEGLVRLMPHTLVDVESKVYVSIPEGIAGMLIIRSSFNRAGLMLASGLWDSGFKGHLGATVYNRSAFPIHTAQGTRMCQLLLLTSDSVGSYGGIYNREVGQSWHQ